MAGLTKAELQELLDEYRKAMKRIAIGAEYTIDTETGSRTLKRADLAEVRKTIEWLQSELNQLDGIKLNTPRL